MSEPLSPKVVGESGIQLAGVAGTRRARGRQLQPEPQLSKR
jgi:hypothetical protein